ncbi:MAG: hypothetical protein NVS9B14_23820 [Candidatus Acidiferrum sp.]
MVQAQRSKLRQVVLISCLMISCYAAWTVLRCQIPSHMEYQGQEIKLSKFYASYEDYKDDPDNIDPSENERVFRLVSQAPVATSFSNRNEMIHALFAVKFPGYGAGPFSEFRQPDGTTLDVSFIEIPRAEKERIFTFHVENGKYILLDDFVLDEYCSVKSAHLESGKITYELANGKAPLVRPVRAETHK